MDQRIIDLYNEYTHAPLDRRVFLERLAKLTGGTAAAAALMPLLEANQARAAIVSSTDPRLETGRITYPGVTVDIKAYLARPKGAPKLPAVIGIGDGNRGRNRGRCFFWFLVCSRRVPVSRYGVMMQPVALIRNRARILDIQSVAITRRGSRTLPTIGKRWMGIPCQRMEAARVRNYRKQRPLLVPSSVTAWVSAEGPGS